MFISIIRRKKVYRQGVALGVVFCLLFSFIVPPFAQSFNLSRKYSRANPNNNSDTLRILTQFAGVKGDPFKIETITSFFANTIAQNGSAKFQETFNIYLENLEELRASEEMRPAIDLVVDQVKNDLLFSKEFQIGKKRYVVGAIKNGTWSNFVVIFDQKNKQFKMVNEKAKVKKLIQFIQESKTGIVFEDILGRGKVVWDEKESNVQRSLIRTFLLPNWIKNLFSTSHYEFLDTFNPIKFFLDHRERSLSQIFGISLIWAAMIATAIGAPFGLDWLISGNPYTHTPNNLFGSALGLFSLLAGIRQVRLQHSPSHIEKMILIQHAPSQLEKIFFSIKYYLYPTNVVIHSFCNLIFRILKLAPLTKIRVMEDPYQWTTREQGIENVRDAIKKNRPDLLERYENLNRLSSKEKEGEEESLRNEIYRIKQGHFNVWGLGSAMHIERSPYFYGSYKNILLAVFPDLDLNPLGFQLDWSTEEKGIESVKYVLNREMPHIMKQYANLAQLSPWEIQYLKNQIYEITQGYFNIWELMGALTRREAPYFFGSYIHVLLAVFPDLDLNPLGFQLDWSTEEKGIESVKYVLNREMPHIMKQYANLAQLSPWEIQYLKNQIYEINQGYFDVFGLSGAITPRAAPYFYGSYIHVLLAVFPDMDLNPLGFRLDWSTEEKIIESVRYVLNREIPHIMKQYAKIKELSIRELIYFKSQIYDIKSGHFHLWGLSNVYQQQVVPSFNSSYRNILIYLFDDPLLELDLNEFEDYRRATFEKIYEWSSLGLGMWNVEDAIDKNKPDIIERYANLNNLNENEIENLKKDIYKISQAHLVAWRVATAMNTKSAPYFNGSYIDALLLVFSNLNLNPLGFCLDWSSEEKGIESVRYALNREIPHIMKLYKNLGQLTENEVKSLRNQIYSITKYHFKIWELASAGNKGAAPYFHGNSIEPLLAVFPDLDLNPLGFQLGWSTKEMGIESVKYILNKEIPHIMEQYSNLERLSEHEIKNIRNVIYNIKKGHFSIWGLGSAMNIENSPYFYGSHINVLLAVFPNLDLNPLGFHLDWSTEEKGIESVRYVLNREIPHIIKLYANLERLSEHEIKNLQNAIYNIKQGYFKVWGLSRAVHMESSPYFHGSYIVALTAVFPDLNLNPLGFQLDWSSEEKGIESVRFVTSREVPHILQQYERLDQLSERDIYDLRNEIYGITQERHFKKWGLSGAMNRQVAPYFHGSYIDALIKLFPHPKLGITREGFLEKSGNGGSVLMTESTRSEAVKRGLNPDGWVAQLFFAPHYEFLDIFDPIKFFKSHEQQTVGQAIGIVMIWAAMVATMIGAPFGIDALLSGSPSTHLGISLISATIGAFSILAGTISNQIKEKKVSLDQSKQNIGLNRAQKLILSIAYLSYPPNFLTHHLYNLISNLTQPFGKHRLSPLMISTYQWRTREEAIKNIYSAILKHRPELIELYENYYLLSPQEIMELKEEFYKFSKKDFLIWGLGRALDKRPVPSFNGSYIEALIVAFPNLNLNPLQYHLDWTSYELAIQSIQYVFSQERPDIIEEYDSLEELPVWAVENLKEKIYRITGSHLKAWGLGVIFNKKQVPYFQGSYGHALSQFFSKLNLNHLGFELQWRTKKEALESIKFVLVQEIPHLMEKYENLDELNQLELDNLIDNIYKIRQADFSTWGLGRASDQKSVPYFKGSYINVLIAVFDKLNLNPLGFELDWSSKEKGIESLLFVLQKEYPSIMIKYNRLESLSPVEIKELQNEIYEIQQTDISAIGLSMVHNRRTTPYFNGSYIEGLMAVFPKLNLNPLGFRLNWSDRNNAVESIKFILLREYPILMEEYQRLHELSDDRINKLRNRIYAITSAHFSVWRLTEAGNRRATPYFNGSYIGALLAVFDDPKLDLTESGFREFRKKTYEVKYQWKLGEETAIENVRDAISNYRPDIINRYDRLETLEDHEREELKNDVYRIHNRHFSLWGLNSAMLNRIAPYFHGSYIKILQKVFARLDLNPLGFQLDWSSREQAIKTVRFVLNKKRPELIRQYEHLAHLTGSQIRVLRKELYKITSNLLKSWGMDAIYSIPYFKGSYIQALIQTFDKLYLDPLGFQLDWSTEENGIKSVRFVLSQNYSYLIQAYERFNQLEPDEIKKLQQRIYQVKHHHLQMWGLNGALFKPIAPYFEGSRAKILMMVFPKLNLNPLGFRLDWSSEEMGIMSIKYVLGEEKPALMRLYEQIDKLNDVEITELKYHLYKITRNHFLVWGLSRAMNQETSSYFEGSYIDALLKIFSDPKLGLTREGFLQRLGNDGTALITEDTRSEAVKRGLNPDGWIAQLFFAPHYEFLDTFDPIKFFKSHEQQTVGQAIGIVMIWAAMVAAMIGAPFGIDVLLSGSPTTHLGMSLITSAIGALSILAGTISNQIKEKKVLLDQSKQNIGLNRTQKLILSIAYLSYPPNFLTHHLYNFISNLTRPIKRWRLKPLTKIRVNEKPYQWTTREEGIENVRDGIRKNRPDLLKRYEKLIHLSVNDRVDAEESLRNEIYRITQGHFNIWGLHGAINRQYFPYFHGSYINVLIAVFPDLNLNPLGFQLDWSSEEKGIESVRYVFYKEVPHIMQQYERIDHLTDRDIHDLRNTIYGIKQAHFSLWGLGGTLTQQVVPYFSGSHMDVLISLFNHPRLGLTLQGFKDFRRATYEQKYNWRSRESAILSVREGIRTHRPELLARYENLEQLNNDQIENLKRDIYRIKSGHFKLWGLGLALHRQQVPYFNGSYINAFLQVFPDLDLDPLGFQLDWSSKEKGVESVKFVLSREVPHIMQQYERLSHLSVTEVQNLIKEIYGITSGHFNVWGLREAINKRVYPYFNGSHIHVLIGLFPDLSLNPLGFQLDWSSKERGEESVKFILSEKAPQIMEQYKVVNRLNPGDLDGNLDDLRREIYKITSKDFNLWGLGSVMIEKLTPYFQGSHVNALIAVFPGLHLNPLGFQLDWTTEEKGIESVRFIFNREVPLIMQEYERLDQLNEGEIHNLRNEIYSISYDHFREWGLSGARYVERAPYFNGGYMNVLLKIFSDPRLGLIREGFLKRTGRVSPPLMTEKSRTQSVKHGFDSDGWIAQLFFAPHYEFLDTFDPVRFFKSHREQTVGQAIGIVMIWAAMVAAMIGAPFGIDYLLSGNPTVHLGISLITSAIGALSILAGTISNQIKEKKVLLDQSKQNIGLNRTQKLILSIAYLSYPINFLTHHLYNFISNLTQPFGKWRLKPLTKTKARAGEYLYHWTTREEGIENVRDAIKKNRPDLLERYENLNQLPLKEKEYAEESLRNDIYRITAGNFLVWGLGTAMSLKLASYFYGSHINALMAVFPDLNLNPLGFQLDWSSKEKGIESMKFVLFKEVPHIMRQYDRLDRLSDRELHDLRNIIYKITSGHFSIWGLGRVMHEQAVPYFYGSYIVALMAVFPDLNLNPLGFHLDWSSEEKGIESMKFVLFKEVPHIMRQYERIDRLEDRDIHDLRNAIYGITQGHFKVWGLSMAMDQRKIPYSHGSYKDVLITIFNHPRLELTLQGFKDYRRATYEQKYSWKTPELGIWNIREGIRTNRPDIISQYENLAQLNEDEIKRLKRDIYEITHGHFKVWGLSGAMNLETAPYFHGSYINALMAVFPDLNLNPLRYQLDWSSEEKGIESMKFVLSNEVPHIMQQYKRLDRLSDRDDDDLRNTIYGITQGHFQVWGLSRAMSQESAPYFHGSYINALMAVFPDLNLNPLGFQLDWSSEDRGIESVKYVLSREIPHIMEQYKRLDHLSDREIHDLRNEIYKISYGHFSIWGLGRAVKQQVAPYFHGSYINALMTVFPDLNLNPLGFQLDWSSQEKGIESMKFVLNKEVPHIMQQYERLDRLSEQDVHDLRNAIYGITQGHFNVWGLSGARSQESAPYFDGTYINALMAVFFDLNLNPLGFQLDWSSEKNGVESVRYVLSNEVPHILQQYERLDSLNEIDIHDLRNNIYGITYGHFKKWGLLGAISRQVAPYFHGSYKDVLLKVFSHPKLGITREGFLEKAGNGSSALMTESTRSEELRGDQDNSNLDILEPIVQPQARFKTWQAKLAYYLFVGSWEEFLFRWGGLIFLPTSLHAFGLNSNLSSLVGFSISAFGFLFSHTIVRWLVQRNSDKWKGWRIEAKNDFLSSKLISTLLLNTIYITALIFHPISPSLILLFAIATHTLLDFSKVYSKKKIEKKSVAEEIGQVAHVLGDSQAELKVLLFENKVNFTSILNSVFSLWTKESNNLQLYLIDLNSAKDQESRLAFLRTIQQFGDYKRNNPLENIKCLIVKEKGPSIEEMSELLDLKDILFIANSPEETIEKLKELSKEQSFSLRVVTTPQNSKIWSSLLEQISKLLDIRMMVFQLLDMGGEIRINLSRFGVANRERRKWMERLVLEGKAEIEGEQAILKAVPFEPPSKDEELKMSRLFKEQA